MPDQTPWPNLPDLPQIRELLEDYETETDPLQKEVKHLFIGIINDAALEAGSVVSKQQLEKLIEGLTALARVIEDGEITRQIAANTKGLIMVLDEPPDGRNRLS